MGFWAAQVIYFFFSIYLGFDTLSRGELAEWSNAAVLKTVEPQGSGGSNPSLSASQLNSFSFVDSVAAPSEAQCSSFVNDLFIK